MIKTKNYSKINGNVKTTFFPKVLAYRFSTLLVVAGCYLIMRFVITDAKVTIILLKNSKEKAFVI